MKARIRPYAGSLRFVLILLGLLVFADGAARADTILFRDLTDGVSVTPISSRMADLVCDTTTLFESCVFSLRPPSPSATLLSPGPLTILVAESAGPSRASDQISVGVFLDPSLGVSLNFFSDTETSPGSIGQCNTPPVIVSCIVETGAVQTAFQLVWSDGTIDAIQFQSDVPQPASWLLVVSGLAIAWQFASRGHRHRRSGRWMLLSRVRETRVTMNGRTLWAVVCAILTVMLLPLPTVAAPLFEWLAPYDVTFTVLVGGNGPFTSGANFGATATANQQTADLGAATDVGPSTAFMRAFVDARSGFFADTDATQVVEFSRAFRLSGSPNGWQVSLTGFYLGFLGINPLGNLNPKASVEVFGGVDSLDVPASPIHVLETVTLDNTGRTTTSSGITLANVPDGNYDFMGSLAAGGSILHSLRFGQAFSDFFSYPSAFGLSLTLSAVPRAAALPPPPPLIPPPPPPPLLTDNSGPTETFFVSVTIPAPGPSSALRLVTGLAILLFFTSRPRQHRPRPAVRGSR
jgi:hypothetical protein